jgi:hypothetical protein
MNIVDIATLSTELLAVSAATKVVTDMIKPVVEGLEAKYRPVTAGTVNAAPFIAAGVSISITALTGISFFEAATPLANAIGIVGAGLVASLGSNYIHDILEALRTVKSLKK